jgi:hypothetical protein
MYRYAFAALGTTSDAVDRDSPFMVMITSHHANPFDLPESQITEYKHRRSEGVPEASRDAHLWPTIL